MKRCSGRVVLVALALSMLPGLSLAQEGLSNEQLKRMYDDAVVQLKSAQDRRNDLARENEKLKGHIAQLEHELAAKQSALDTIADRTFQARSEWAAFTDFLASEPSIRVQWQLFLEHNLFPEPNLSDFIDCDWPLSALCK